MINGVTSIGLRTPYPASVIRRIKNQSTASGPTVLEGDPIDLRVVVVLMPDAVQLLIQPPDFLSAGFLDGPSTRRLSR